MMDDLLTDFLAETDELLAEAGGAIVAWESDPADRDRLDAIFRLVHTIKGSSGFLALPRITALSHAAEDTLDQVRRGNRTANAALVTGVLAIIDRLSEICAALAAKGTEPPGDDASVIAMLTSDAGAGEAAAAPATVPANGDHGHDAQAELQHWRSIRVPLPLLDSVMTGVTDIVLARNEFVRMLRDSGADPTVLGAFDRLSDSIAGMRQSVSQMRMQRIDKLFAPLPRIVRDVAQDMGKKIRFSASGGEVELDREMMENIRDPLIHIIRNAIDHGIETPDQRVAAGKDVVGSISVSARQSGNQIEIEISDDGRGLSADKLVAKAVSAKLIGTSDTRTMTPKEKLDLVFLPGFSTAAKVTAISGRGVGMDIVKSNLEKIGGLVELRNDEGHGLSILIRVPMTLTIISGLLVSAGSQTFAIPRGAVREILLEDNEAVRIDRLGGCEIATVRGERLALVRLETILGSIDTDAVPDEDRALIVLRPGKGRAYALSVAAIHDHEELVIKPAAPMIMGTGIYAGTTLPDNGRPVLLLDVQGLVEVAGIDTSGLDSGAETVDAVTVMAQNASQLLLFRDSDRRTRVIHLSVIERVEEVAAGALFESAGVIQVTIGGEIFPVHTARLPGDGAISVKLLRVTDGTTMLCYPIDAVIDIIRAPEMVQTAKTSGLIAGVMLVGGEPVEVIDPFWLMEQYAVGAAPVLDRQPTCRLSGDGDGWATNFLAPILRSAGYRIVAEDQDEAADVVLAVSDATRDVGDAVPVVRLRSSLQSDGPGDDSIYRYDRAAIVGALRQRIGGNRA